MVWTGEEVVVVGGYDNAPCPPTADCAAGPMLRDGAAYAPATGRWRRLPQAPTGVAFGPTVMWRGAVHLMSGAHHLAFDPGTDRWRSLAAPPSADYLVVAGNRLIAAAGDRRRGRPTTDWWYDATRNRWHALPPDPVRAASTRTLLSLGGRMALVASTDHDTILTVLDLDTMTWSAPTAIPSVSGNPTVVHGRVVFPGIYSQPDGARYGVFPPGGTWSPEIGFVRLHRSPYPDTGIGFQITVDDRVIAAGALLRPRSGRWKQLPEPPRHPRGWGIAIDGGAFFFGGPAAHEDRFRNDGLILMLPAEQQQ
jgi:hypothetical protein